MGNRKFGWDGDRLINFAQADTSAELIEVRVGTEVTQAGVGEGNSLPATALVHEVYLRLVDVDSVNRQDRAHFFAVSANMMRRILVDRARSKDMSKRGSAAPPVNLDEVPEMASRGRDREIVAVGEALDALAQIGARKAKVIELRFFGALSVERLLRF